MSDLPSTPSRLTSTWNRIRIWLAWWCVHLLFGPAEKGVDYTSRCPGCGYYAGEEKAGEDHYGWSCGVVKIPWWEPIQAWFNNNWRR